MEEKIRMVEAAYLQGNYNSCEQICNVLNEQCRNSKLSLSDYGFCQQVLSCIMENNILTLKSLTWIRDRGSHELWNDILQNFLQLVHEYVSLQVLNNIPLKYYLNAMHNTLWWGLWHPHGFQTERFHIETCFHVASDCFKKVLEDCGSPCASPSFSESEDVLTHLMKKVAENLFKLNRDLMLQLVDIFILVMLMLLELEPRRETCLGCIDIASSVLSERDRVLKLKPSAEREWRCNLKLGLVQINSSVERTDAQVSLTLLKICCCMFHIKAEQYAECVNCLEGSQPADVELSFVENYMRAFACYKGSDLEASLLFLLTLENMAVSSQMKVKYRLLSGLVLSKAGRRNDALMEFFKALHADCKEEVALALHCIAREYETLYKGCPTGNLRSSLQSDYVDTLQHLVQVLKDEPNTNLHSSFCIRLKILNIVHKQPVVTLSEALYLLGTALANSGNITAACEVFVELLAQPDVLPHASASHHSAAALLLMCDKVEEAETVCKQAISCYVPQNHGLLSLEDDVVGLMLLAQVYKVTAKHTQADILDKCLRIIKNFKRQKHATSGSEMLEVMKLLNMLSAKLHAEKADNYLKRSPACRRDAFYELKQAILCNPDDEDVLNRYKRLVDGTPSYAVTTHRQKLNLPSEDCSEIALTYLMESYSRC